MPPASSLRAVRARVVDDPSLGGAAFGEALAGVLDEFFTGTSSGLDIPDRWALVALGSYARRERCPGSDVDVMFLHEARRPPVETASGLWYPLWDAGVVLGQSTRTVKEAVALADADLDALTALLDTRVVAGDASLSAELDDRVRRLAQRRRRRVVDALAAAAQARVERPGPVAEMLEPNLKDGAGGLRDLHALAWAGLVLVPGNGAPANGHHGGSERDGLATLVERGYLQPGDRDRLAAARAWLLDVRVALHRATGGRSDLLTLQEQDAVARRLGVPDADALVRSVATAARTVAWVASEAWTRLCSAERGPAGRGARDRVLAADVVLRDGRVTVAVGAGVDAALVLRAAGAAAGLGATLDRAALDRFSLEMGEPAWGREEREGFVSLLRAGRRAVPVLEALDHVGVLTRLLPEWEHVRSLPQRNAYHRFTVDRHLLEAVAECAALLAVDGLDGDVARRCRADLLLLGALLHDIGKGLPGDHSAGGAAAAREVATRIGLDEPATETLVWLVRHHLMLAETATRRDLSDPTAVTRFGRSVGDAERLDLLYALTIGDSRATGPAAWSAPKAALLRELFVRTDALFEAGVVVPPANAARRRELATLLGAVEADAYLDAMPAAYAAAVEPATQAQHHELLGARRISVEWRDLADGMIECTVVAPDRTGLLATVAGALALCGLDIRDAACFSHRDGMALEVFTGTDRFGRLAAADGRARAVAMLSDALGGRLALDARLRDRARRYRPPVAATAVSLEIDLDASDIATVVEVHAPDEVGLLARLAATFTDLDLDVVLAKVATLGDRVVDVFYVQDRAGAKVTERLALDRLRATLMARLTRDLVLP